MFRARPGLGVRASQSTTVVIACHTEDRWDLLIRAVNSVLGQSIPAARIIVVVDHNNALFRRLCSAEIVGITLCENTYTAGASGARNTGAFAATTPYVAFLDDDAVAEPEWLANVVAPFGDPLVVGAGGRVLPDWPDHRPVWFPEEFDWVVGASYLGMPTRTVPVRNVWAENMAVRSEVFDAVGGFRTGFGKLGRHSRPEDTDVCIRMAAAIPDGTWMYQPDAVVTHHVPSGRCTYRFFLHRTYHEGRGKAELARLLPEPATALSTERDYVRSTLPAGVLTHLVQGLRTGRAGEAGRSVNIVVGLVSTVIGFAVQRFVDSRRAAPAAGSITSGRANAEWAA